MNKVIELQHELETVILDRIIEQVPNIATDPVAKCFGANVAKATWERLNQLVDLTDVDVLLNLLTPNGITTVYNMIG